MLDRGRAVGRTVDFLGATLLGIGRLARARSPEAGGRLVAALREAGLGSLPIVALWRSRWPNSRTLAFGLFAAATLSGALDVFRVASRQSAFRLFDADGVAIAAAIRDATPPRAVVLHAPVHDSPVYLTGRRSLLGYPGHMWSQGLDAGQREAEIARIYAGAADGGATGLLAASIFHFGQHTVREAKAYLAERGLAVRP